RRAARGDPGAGLRGARTRLSRGDRGRRRPADGARHLPRRLMPADGATKSALVTGAAGFIGSHVVDECLALGMEVLATDALSGRFRENVAPAATFVPGDLRDAGFVAGLWAERRFDYLYHLGAYAAEGLSHFVRAFNYRNNLEASVNLVNQAVLHD